MILADTSHAANQERPVEIADAINRSSTASGREATDQHCETQ
jgi:hypothetical protein